VVIATFQHKSNISSHFTETAEYQMSWKSVSRLQSLYSRTDGRTNWNTDRSKRSGWLPSICNHL